MVSKQSRLLAGELYQRVTVGECWERESSGKVL